MWLWALVEAVGHIFTGSSLCKLPERMRFKRKYGVDAYNAVLGEKFRNYLDDYYDLPKGWSWQCRVIRFVEQSLLFEVRYDDNGDRSGVIEVCLLSGSPSYHPINPEHPGAHNPGKRPGFSTDP